MFITCQDWRDKVPDLPIINLNQFTHSFNLYKSLSSGLVATYLASRNKDTKLSCSWPPKQLQVTKGMWELV